MKKVFPWIAWFIITGGTTSYWFFKKAPGTTGSFFATLGLWLCYLHGWWSVDFFIWGVIGTYLLGLICIPAGERLMAEKWGKEKKYGQAEGVEHDYGLTVIDEINGMFFSAMSLYWAVKVNWLPVLSDSEMLLALFAVFVIFRFFDITKVLGIRILEENFKMAGELSTGKSKSFFISNGIILDDSLAGIYTWFFSLGLIQLIF